MSTESDERSGFGLRNALGWTIGGALAGITGAAAFGVLMWLFDPGIVDAAIPALYGVEPAGIVGWGIHLGHGAVLGLVFGFFVTREFVLGALRTDVDTEALSETGVVMRVAAAGFAFGMAVWAILPVLVLPAWFQAVGAETTDEFSAVAVESLAGHLLFGVVLGLVFAIVVDLTDRPIEALVDE